MRFAEIDFVRGSAIVMMLVSNFVTDLQYFYNYNSYETFWRIFATITASIFLLVVGISLNLSYSR
ncbi:MAG: heparan-alpha-glucosaminide N-acetyltransferase domain-containing protein, partial [Candidatus Nanoarchaeia archaeon]